MMMQPEALARLETALSTIADSLTRGSRLHDPDRRGGWEPELSRVGRAVLGEVTGAAAAGLTLRESDGGLSSYGATDASVAELDRTQVELGEGPCLDAVVRDAATVIVVPDMATEARWRRFALAAHQAGIGSMLSVALAPQGAAPGALNLYAPRSGAFDAASRMVATAFAMQAAVALYGARRVAALERGLASRDEIGQAKGIVMERLALDDTQAFDLLVRTSQDTNIKLIDVARWLTREAALRAHRNRPPGEDPTSTAPGGQAPPPHRRVPDTSADRLGEHPDGRHPAP